MDEVSYRGGVSGPFVWLPWPAAILTVNRDEAKLRSIVGVARVRRDQVARVHLREGCPGGSCGSRDRAADSALRLCSSRERRSRWSKTSANWAGSSTRTRPTYEASSRGVKVPLTDIE